VRTVSPFDIDTVAASVVKTGHLVIADNDWSFCGFAAEISAQVTETCFGQLKAAPCRIGFANVPCPTTRPLENLFYPTAKEIVRAVEMQLDLSEIDLSGEVFNEYEKRFRGPF
jgi:pyruvate dehydrogenase E1 component beta subunit